jgi:hypothetical protein
MLFGSGFILEKDQLCNFDYNHNIETNQVIRPYVNGRDLAAKNRNVFVIDLFGLSAEEVRAKFPKVFQHVFNHVKPERDQNRDKSISENWWLFGRTRAEIRDALEGLHRYIATVETSKHRFFTFLDISILPDNKLIAIALPDAYFLGVLSSRTHVSWALAAGGNLGVGNDPVYVKTKCFEAFPFPAANEPQKEKIRQLAEQLDAHRKARQALHPTLTITDMYNVLEKLRAGEPLTAKEQKIHEQGLVSILLQLHQELDAAVAAAYGWPADLPEQEVLERLVQLNHQRAAEEARGLIRWLRPAYQHPQGTQQTDIGLTTAAKAAKATPKEFLVWPKTLAEQAQAVQRALQQHERPATAGELYRQFKPVGKEQRPQRVQQIDGLLQTLHALGLVRKTEEEAYVK